MLEKQHFVILDMVFQRYRVDPLRTSGRKIDANEWRLYPAVRRVTGDDKRVNSDLWRPTGGPPAIEWCSGNDNSTRPFTQLMVKVHSYQLPATVEVRVSMQVVARMSRGATTTWSSARIYCWVLTVALEKTVLITHQSDHCFGRYVGGSRRGLRSACQPEISLPKSAVYPYIS